MTELQRLEQDAKDAGRATWPRLRRFVNGFLTAFVAGVTTAGLNHLSFATLAGAAAGALFLAAGEAYPSIPWKSAYRLLHRQRQLPPLPPSALGEADGPSGPP